MLCSFGFEICMILSYLENFFPLTVSVLETWAKCYSRGNALF
jgi:hypothetical protein